MGVALENARLFDETKRLPDRDGRAGRRAGDHQRRPAGPRRSSSTCRRCTTSSATGSRRSSTPRSSTSAIYDRETGLIHFPYTIERGVRFPDEPMPLIGLRKHVIETREPLLINDDAHRSVSSELGQRRRDSRARRRSRRSGRRSSSATRRAASSRSRTSTASTPSPRPTCELLTTLAASLSVALENARLIDETRQRRHRAGDGQRGRPGAVQPARPRPAVRARRRPDAATRSTADIVLRRAPRRRDATGSSSPTTARTASTTGQEPLPVRPGPDVADPQRRGSRCCSTATTDFEALGTRGVGTPVEVVPRRPDRRRRPGDRRDQRPEHAARRAASARRRAAALDDRRQRRRRDPERPALPRGAAPRRRDGGPRRRRPGDLGDARPSGGPGADRRARRGRCSTADTSAVFLADPTARPSGRSSPGASSPRRSGPTRSSLGEGIIGDVVRRRDARDRQRRRRGSADRGRSRARTTRTSRSG